MTDTDRHGMEGLPKSRFHAMMKCQGRLRTPVRDVSGRNIKPAGDRRWIEFREICSRLGAGLLSSRALLALENLGNSGQIGHRSHAHLLHQAALVNLDGDLADA